MRHSLYVVKLTQRELLPEKLSFSPIEVPFGSSFLRLARRDLFDVRFQLLNDEESAQGVADTHTDLIPGVYEGGLKTWECSLDLVATLAERLPSYHAEDASWPSGRHIVELGCGTAVPTCFLFRTLFSTQPSDRPTVLDLCDYNEEVLSLVRVYPNAGRLSQSSPELVLLCGRPRSRPVGRGGRLGDRPRPLDAV